MRYIPRSIARPRNSVPHRSNPGPSPFAGGIVNYIETGSRGPSHPAQPPQPPEPAHPAPAIQPPNPNIPQPPHYKAVAAASAPAPEAVSLPHSVPPSPPPVSPHKFLDAISQIPQLSALSAACTAYPELLLPAPPPEPAEPEPQNDSAAPKSRTSRKFSARPKPAPRQSHSAIVPSPKRLEFLRSRNLPSDLDRHARKCSVCNHPDRDAIEADFIRWRKPAVLASEYAISDQAAIYRHAHALNLFGSRRELSRIVLEKFLERADHVSVNAGDIIKAFRLYARLNDRSEWIDAPSTHIVVPAFPQSAAVPPSRPQMQSRGNRQPRNHSSRSKHPRPRANNRTISNRKTGIRKSRNPLKTKGGGTR